MQQLEDGALQEGHSIWTTSSSSSESSQEEQTKELRMSPEGFRSNEPQNSNTPKESSGDEGLGQNSGLSTMNQQTCWLSSAEGCNPQDSDESHSSGTEAGKGLLNSESTRRSIPMNSGAACFSQDALSNQVPPATLSSLLPPIGSIGHDAGECRPCHYAFIKRGCSNGDQCQFCHYSHQHLKKRRPCKKQRDGYKRLIASMDGNQVQDAQLATGHNPYLKNKLKEKLRQLVNEASHQGNQQINHTLHLEEDHGGQSGGNIQTDSAADHRRNDAVPAAPKEQSETTGSSSSTQIPRIKKLLSL